MSLVHYENMIEMTRLSSIMPEESKGKLWTRIILSKSFIGDPRAMHQQYSKTTNNISIKRSDQN